MDPFQQYPVLQALLKPFWRRHQKTLALVIAGIAAAGQARSFAIATCMQSWLGGRLDSAVNRFYRLLRNRRVDYTEFCSAWAQLLAKPRQGRLVVAIDWTEWHHDLRMLMAAAVVGRRALPLFAQAWAKSVRRRSQNAQENTFLRVLADGLRRAAVHAVILCDRGFRRVSWIALLQKLQLGFVVRLMDDVSVYVDGDVKPLSTVVLPRGRVVDLGVVPLRSDGAVEVRVIGYWAPNAKEPWWLATSETGRASQAVTLYDRRMTVEEQFRDTKGRRFGVKLFWTQFRDPDALARFTMLLGVALLIWMVTGTRAAHEDPTLRLVSRQKGPRQSYVTIGVRIIAANPAALVLTVGILRRWLEPPLERRVATRGIGGAK